MKKEIVPCLAAIVFAITAIAPVLGEADVILAQNLKIDKDKFCGKRS